MAETDTGLIDFRVGEQIVRGKWYNSKVLRVGSWRVGMVFYTALVAQGDPKKYQATCLLPGVKDTLGRYETQDEAQAELEKAVRHWLQNLSTTKQ